MLDNERWWHKARNTLSGFIGNISKYIVSNDEVDLIKAKNLATIIVEMGRDKNNIFENAREDILQHLNMVKTLKKGRLQKMIEEAEIYRDEIKSEYITPFVKEKTETYSFSDKIKKIKNSIRFS